MKFLILFIFWTASVFAQDEASLLQSCKKADLIACEKLGAYYISRESWSNAYMIGEMLCGKDVAMGCTFAGTSLLAQKKTKEGLSFLNKSCDRFEPHACRSIGRLMKNSKEKLLAYMYFKRACQYGLRETCTKLDKPKTTYSKHGLELIKKIHSACVDTTMSICQDQLDIVGKCPAPLTKEDCSLLPGELSIYFRAKLMQTEAGLSLTTIMAQQKILKETPNSAGYSYDLAKVLKTFKPLNMYNYVFGFMKACRNKYGERKWNTNSLELFPDSYKHLSSRQRANITEFFGNGRGDDCYDPKGGFQAFAVGSLDALNPRRLDVWKTNQDGNLMNMTDGLPVP